MTSAPHTPAPPLDHDTALTFATRPGLLPGERLEFLHYLGYPEQIPSNIKDRVALVIGRIMADSEAGAATKIEAAYRRGWDDRAAVAGRLNRATGQPH